VPPYVQYISKYFRSESQAKIAYQRVYNKLRLNNVQRSSLLSGISLKYSEHTFCRPSGVILSTCDINVRFLLNVRNSLKIKLYDQKNNKHSSIFTCHKILGFFQSVSGNFTLLLAPYSPDRYSTMQIKHETYTFQTVRDLSHSSL
jgi:hypothetical protein